MKVKIANYQASSHTRNKQPFMGSNLFAEWRTGKDGHARYVVFSYGNHWPLYIWDATTEQWYGNLSHFSRSTMRHRTQAKPDNITSADIIPMHVHDMIKIVDAGVPGII